MGYIVEERVFDASYWDNVIISTYTYTKDGILNDGCVWTNENDPGGLNPFYGRPKEKIRFKLGDIVEVCQGGESELHIIHQLLRKNLRNVVKRVGKKKEIRRKMERGLTPQMIAIWLIR